jgi:putative membrane protein
MLVAALVIAALAAVLHVYIFAMESLWWTTPRVRATFGVSEADAQTTRGLALNQGFYNLFLAAVTVAGIVAWSVGAHSVGAALVIAGVGSMLAAAIVLILSDRTKAPAAVKQGTLPLLALALLAISAL